MTIEASDNLSISENVTVEIRDLGLIEEVRRMLNLLPHWWRKDGV